MKKKPFVTNEYGKKNNRVAWAAQKEAVQKVVNAYNALGFSPLVGDEFVKLFSDTQNLLYDKLTEGESAQLVMGDAKNNKAMEISRTAAMSMISKPKGYDALLKLAEQAKFDLKGGVRPAGVGQEQYAIVYVDNLRKYFALDSSGNVCYTDGIKTAIAEYGDQYLKSKAGQKCADLVDSLVSGYFAAGLDKLGYDPMRIYELVVSRIDNSTKSYAPYLNFMATDRQWAELEESGGKLV